MTRKSRRMTIFAVAGLLLAGATTLVLLAFQDNLVFFQSPSDIAAGAPPSGRDIRLGGLVEAGSVEKSGGQEVRFAITDGAERVEVVYVGILPDLFREGQGVVTQGRLGGDGVFVASEVLAKHDETYMPREVADALKESGHWRDGESATQ